ncbi:hypothetical protein KFU94_52620 [Chloroflexi bacterium TSY]|nr:hypothetical protein [Chloroflexi bacterium TSY]
MTDNVRPTFEELLDWIDGRLSPQEIAKVETKVASLLSGNEEAIQAEVLWLQAFVRLRGELNHEVPPTRVRSNLRNQFAQYAQHRSISQSTRNAQPSVLRQLIASLTFDSGATVASAGARTAQTADTRLLTFRAEVADIVINVHRPHDQQKVGINGQLLPLETFPLEHVRIELMLDEEVITSTTANSLGEFAFESVAQHDYQMKFVGDTFQIILEISDIY